MYHIPQTPSFSGYPKNVATSPAQPSPNSKPDDPCVKPSDDIVDLDSVHLDIPDTQTASKRSWPEIKDEFEKSDYYQNMIASEHIYKDHDPIFWKNVERREFLLAYKRLCQFMEKKSYDVEIPVSYARLFRVLEDDYFLNGYLTLEVFLKNEVFIHTKLKPYIANIAWQLLMTDVGKQWVHSGSGSVQQLIDWQIMSINKRYELFGDTSNPTIDAEEYSLAGLVHKPLFKEHFKKYFDEKKLSIKQMADMIEKKLLWRLLPFNSCQGGPYTYDPDKISEYIFNDSMTIDDLCKVSTPALMYIYGDASASGKIRIKEEPVAIQKLLIQKGFSESSCVIS